MDPQSGITVEVDHVVVVVPDLGVAADYLRFRHGVDSVSGGRHPGHGTANRIVPLGPNYIELLTVADEEEAGESEFGRWALALRDPELRVGALCLRTDDLDTICQDLDLVAVEMSRTRPDGSELRWRLAGLEGALRDERLPFFVQWRSEADFPSLIEVDHQTEVAGITSVTIAGDEPQLNRMIRGADLVGIVPGPPGIVSVTLSKSNGDLVLSGGEPS